MTSNPYLKSALALAALGYIPLMIRKTLLGDLGFRVRFDIEADSTLSFNVYGISIQRSILFSAVREVLSGTPIKQVTDKNGRRWKIRNQNIEGGLPHLVMTRGKQCISLPELICLSTDKDVRLRFLDKVASDVNLHKSAYDTWHKILINRALDDNEVNIFNSELRDTPVEVMRCIHNEIIDKQFNPSSFVPLSRRYYERLIGIYNAELSIRDYAASGGKNIISQLSAWKPYDGFLFNLYLSSHSSLTSEINIEKLDSKELISAFDYLDKHGDLISQLGAIEVGLRYISIRPEIEPALIRLIVQIRDDNIDNKTSGFKLLSALFLLVDGELSKARLFSIEPPFYRRLVALSQAALIHHHLVDLTIDTDQLYDWTFNTYGEQFYMQSLVDMRQEPRWNPDFALASQIKAYFLGRIMTAGEKRKQYINDGELFDLVLSTKSGSLYTSCDPLLPSLPGALEGAELSQKPLPKKIADIIESHLSVENIEPSSFIALVNSALIFNISEKHVKLAANVLKLSNYRLVNIENRTQLLETLNGLAIVAAITRSCTLADELRTLVRRYRRDAQYSLSTDEVLRICLVAAASRSDLKEWTDFVGDLITELAFSDLKDDDGVDLHSRMRCLCQIVPELWATCGKADAALLAVNMN